MKNMGTKKIIIRIILIILTFFLTTNCKKKTEDSNENPEKAMEKKINSAQNDWIVTADGGLNARETPELNGKVAFLIPQYAQIKPISEIGKPIEINEKKGKWTKIKFGDKTGYVFGGYLAKFKILTHLMNSDSSYFFNLYSLSENEAEEPPDCRNNYMNFGCLVVVYKEADKKVINSFPDMVAVDWIDKAHLAESWIIGDAGYGGEGIRSIDIHTKANTDIWKMESQMSISEEEPGPSSETLCLKNFCYDLIKNQDIIVKIKSTRGLKFYKKGEYKDKLETFSTEVPIAENKSILFLPELNVVIEK